jgi:hypothetical protein
VSTRKSKRELVRETEAYLSGCYAEYLDARNLVVPDWAWLSVLAHGSLDHLRWLALRSRDVRPTRTALGWQAVAFLASEIVSQIDDDRGLDELRRAALLPLELTWPSVDTTAKGPVRLVRMVLHALDQHRKSWRR